MENRALTSVIVQVSGEKWPDADGIRLWMVGMLREQGVRPDLIVDSSYLPGDGRARAVRPNPYFTRFIIDQGLNINHLPGVGPVGVFRSGKDYVTFVVDEGANRVTITLNTADIDLEPLLTGLEVFDPIESSYSVEGSEGGHPDTRAGMRMHNGWVGTA